MMKSILVYLTLLLGSIYLPVQASRNIEEEVFLKVNTSTLLSGETILYSAFVNSKTTGKPSPLSKILYVELLNSEGKVAHQSKLKVEEGRASGDIFISSTLSTGVYRLVAYTKWMRNFESFFEVQLTIINPFETVDVKRYENREWSLTFNTGSSGIILGLENTVGYKLNFPNGKEEPFKAKVVDTEGNKVSEFSDTGKAYGSFRFKPSNLSKHRVILEDGNGEFYFFDLPNIVNSGTILSQVTFDDFTVFSVQSTDEHDNIQLIITNKQGYEFRQAVSIGSSIKFLHKDLESGLYTVKIMQEDLVLGSLASYICTEEDVDANKLKINNKEYGGRSLVTIDETLPIGSYVVSVRKTRDGFVDHRPSAASYYQLFSQVKNSIELPIENFDVTELSKEDINLLMLGRELVADKVYDSIYFLPDHRGELIQGRVTDANNTPLNDRYVSFSVVNENHYVSAKTNSDGRFVINNYSVNEDVKSYLKVYESTGYQIELEDGFMINHGVLEASKLQLDSSSIADLVKSSINIQIENAYFDVKKDSSYHSVDGVALFEELQFDFLLDDYNRFRTIKETLTEYIPYLAVRRENGEPVIKVRTEEVFVDSYAPLLLLDGVPVSSVDLLAFSPFKIKRISGFNSRVYIGCQIFDGLALFETFEGDLHGLEVDPNYLFHELKALEDNKIYQFPSYTDDSLDRIPDQREQLYWNPQLKSDGAPQKIDFYTSDIPGDYVIEIDGFRQEGTPVYKKGVIRVK